jgi:23S rRNA pseudouridine2605 synthase
MIMMADRTQTEEKGERLQKVLAKAGVASRRQAERLIAEGQVTVNGMTVSVLGTKVTAQDRVEINGHPLQRSERLHYYVLNKPVRVITSAKDPQGRPTVLDLLKDVPVRVYPVGRLDYDTSGLLVLTNDGELAHRLMHPSYGVEKTYRVWVKGTVGNATLDHLRRGVLLEDGNTAPAIVKRLSGVSHRNKTDAKNTTLDVLEITIHEGRNRQVRRMFDAVGYSVVKLERVSFGPINQEKQLLPGKFRSLTLSEIKKLRTLVGL